MNPEKNTVWFWIFILPVLLALVLVVGVPFVLGLYYSFTDWDGIIKPVFIGIKNYRAIFSDPQFLNSLIFTVKFAVVSIVLINAIGLALAILVTQKIFAANIFRTIYFMPNLIGGLILGFIWQFIFINIFPALGLKGWLATTNTGFWGLILLTIWQMAGYIMVIYVAYLQNVSQEVLEAADVDGVNAWQKFRHIIFPLIATGFTVSMFMTLSNSFKLYDQNLSLTNGGPYRSTEMVAMNIVNTAFAEKSMAYAQAKSVIFLLIVVMISIIQTYYNKKREIEA